jgi:hypothetical protein
MNTDKFKELKESLDKEEERIRAIKAGIDPAQIAELESTRGVLSFWEQQIKSRAWNTENEDGSMFRLVDKPHQVALKIIGFEDGEVTNRLGFPASKRDMLNKLQVKLAVFNDKIEVNCLFPVELINIQLCSSIGGLRGIYSLAFIFSRIFSVTPAVFVSTSLSLNRSTVKPQFSIYLSFILSALAILSE